MAGRPLWVGIELGGSKILCRVMDGDGHVLADRRYHTSTPAAAVDDIAACIQPAATDGGVVVAIGVASFGPLVIDARSSRYGCLLETPKRGWSGFNIRRALMERFDAPVIIDTDVNAAALAEHIRGAGQGLRSIAYVTVGTGIGGGLATEHGLLKGALHPEIGHIRVRRRAGDVQPSTCPFHEDCAEGLAAGPAIRRRLGESRTLMQTPAVSALIAQYLGELAATLVLAWAPHRLVFGGGVMTAPALLGEVEKAMRESLCHYGLEDAKHPGYLVAAHLTDAGLEGALILARSGFTGSPP